MAKRTRTRRRASAKSTYRGRRTTTRARRSTGRVRRTSSRGTTQTLRLIVEGVGASSVARPETIGAAEPRTPRPARF